MQPYDIFGNKHCPDDVGYCDCWQCPKQIGFYPFNTWWTPNPKYVRSDNATGA